jgi:sec-independent protein translocase protein TatC
MGVGFGYYIVFPFTFSTLLNFGEVQVEAFMNMKDYLVLSSKILVFLGIVFQLPNAMLILGYMGVVNGKKLLAAMKYVTVVFAIVSAMLTPPDPITMMALWIPLVLLYLLGVVLVFLLVDPFKSKESDELVPQDEENQ